MSATHYPLTCHVYVEERDLSGVSGCNVRVAVLANNGETARVRVDDCGVVARQGQIVEVPASALNGGRR